MAVDTLICVSAPGPTRGRGRWPWRMSVVGALSLQYIRDCHLLSPCTLYSNSPSTELPFSSRTVTCKDSGRWPHRHSRCPTPGSAIALLSIGFERPSRTPAPQITSKQVGHLCVMLREGHSVADLGDICGVTLRTERLYEFLKLLHGTMYTTTISTLEVTRHVKHLSNTLRMVDPPELLAVWEDEIIPCRVQ